MTDAREMLAVFGPRSPSLEWLGGGGTAQAVGKAQTVAAALGMCDDGIGRDLLTVLWCSDPHSTILRQLEYRMVDLIGGEARKRRAHLKFREFLNEIAGDGSTHPSGKVRALHMAAQAEAWPLPNDEHRPTYKRIMCAVLSEMRGSVAARLAAARVASWRTRSSDLAASARVAAISR